MKKKGFTLIELIAVLVILAILALIVTPLVMNIIRKAKDAANRKSVDAYGRSVELAIATHLLDTGTFPTDLSSLTIEYTGKEVICNIMQMKENGGIYLSECTVGSKQVKDDSTEDGYYHYGTRDLTNEDYVDMYGKALEKALKDYYDINNSYPEDYNNLTVDYSGKEVSCSVTMNYDGTVYLTYCNVDNVSILDSSTEDGYYHYGKPKKYVYYIGEKVSYKDIDFYVIKDSGESVDTITLLKAEPLTLNEVNRYGGVGTANNHVNMYVGNNLPKPCYQTAFDCEGYGCMAYYSSLSCGYNGSSWVYTDCKNDYASSDIKYVIDAWTAENIEQNDLKNDSIGYSTRLITYNELIDNLGYDPQLSSSGNIYLNDNVPSWVYDVGNYWTMSAYGENNKIVYNVDFRGLITNYSEIIDPQNKVRPVITLKKSAIDN